MVHTGPGTIFADEFGLAPGNLAPGPRTAQGQVSREVALLPALGQSPRRSSQDVPRSSAPSTPPLPFHPSSRHEGCRQSFFLSNIWGCHLTMHVPDLVSLFRVRASTASNPSACQRVPCQGDLDRLGSSSRMAGLKSLFFQFRSMAARNVPVFTSTDFNFLSSSKASVINCFISWPEVGVEALVTNPPAAAFGGGEVIIGSNDHLREGGLYLLLGASCLCWRSSCRRCSPRSLAILCRMRNSTTHQAL